MICYHARLHIFWGKLLKLLHNDIMSWYSLYFCDPFLGVIFLWDISREENKTLGKGHRSCRICRTNSAVFFYSLILPNFRYFAPRLEYRPFERAILAIAQSAIVWDCEGANCMSIPGGPEGGPDAINTGGGLGGAWSPPIRTKLFIITKN